MSTKPPNDSTDVYLDVINRLEPDITMIDRDAALASIAISLKRLADLQENMLDVYQAIAEAQK